MTRTLFVVLTAILAAAGWCQAGQEDLRRRAERQFNLPLPNFFSRPDRSSVESFYRYGDGRRFSRTDPRVTALLEKLSLRGDLSADEDREMFRLFREHTEMLDAETGRKTASGTGLLPFGKTFAGTVLLRGSPASVRVVYGRSILVNGDFYLAYHIGRELDAARLVLEGSAVVEHKLVGIQIDPRSVAGIKADLDRFAQGLENSDEVRCGAEDNAFLLLLDKLDGTTVGNCMRLDPREP